MKAGNGATAIAKMCVNDFSARASLTDKFTSVSTSQTCAWRSLLRLHGVLFDDLLGRERSRGARQELPQQRNTRSNSSASVSAMHTRNAHTNRSRRERASANHERNGRKRAFALRDHHVCRASVWRSKTHCMSSLLLCRHESTLSTPDLRDTLLRLHTHDARELSSGASTRTHCD